MCFGDPIFPLKCIVERKFKAVILQEVELVTAEWLASNKMTSFMFKVSNLVTYAFLIPRKYPLNMLHRLKKKKKKVFFFFFFPRYSVKDLHWCCKALPSILLFSVVHRLPGVSKGLRSLPSPLPSFLKPTVSSV